MINEINYNNKSKLNYNQNLETIYDQEISSKDTIDSTLKGNMNMEPTKITTKTLITK